MTEEQLRKLPTKRLLAYKRKHFPSYNCPWEVEDHIFDCNCETCTEDKKRIDHYIENHKLLKSILKEREHCGN